MSLSEKSKVRSRLLSHRKALSVSEIASLSNKIFSHFLSRYDEVFPSKLTSVGLYAPIHGEVDTVRFFEFFKKVGVRCLFPKIVGSGLEFFAVDDLNGLKPGRFGVLEPISSTAVQPQAVFVPGVAFAPDCHRLGFGAGYYDKLINSWENFESRSRVFLLGLAYDFQIVIEFDAESHDKPLDAVMTETRIFRRTTK